MVEIKTDVNGLWVIRRRAPLTFRTIEGEGVLVRLTQTEYYTDNILAPDFIRANMVHVGGDPDLFKFWELVMVPRIPVRPFLLEVSSLRTMRSSPDEPLSFEVRAYVTGGMRAEGLKGMWAARVAK